MSFRLWRFRLQDILDAIAPIQSYTQGMDMEHFKADSKTMDAVERNLLSSARPPATYQMKLLSDSHRSHGERCRTCETSWYTPIGVLIYEEYGTPSSKTSHPLSPCSKPSWTPKPMTDNRIGTRPGMICLW